MNKSFTIFFTLVITCGALKAQTKKGDFNIVIQPQILIPVSDIKLTNSFALGGYFSFEKTMSEKARFLVSFGGGLFPGKDYKLENGYQDSYTATTLAQLRIGVKYFIYDNHLWTSVIAGGVQSFKKGANALGFSYSPALGYAISDRFDVSVRYDASIFKNYTIGGIGFSLGYHLGD